MKPRLAILVVVCTIGGVLGAGTQMASANSPIVVTTMADVVNASDGVVSLREAVTKANNDAGADTIVLSGPPSEYDLTTCDGSYLEEDANASGDLDVTDPAGLSIGSNTVIAQACAPESEERVFEVAEGASLDLDHVNVTGGHGDADYNDGAVAILVGRNAHLTTASVLVSDNGRVAADLERGGIVGGMSGSTMVLSHSAVSHNQNATGVVSFGTASLVDSLVADNIAPKADAGGLYGTFDLTRTEVSDNQGEDFGGAFLMGDVMDSTIKGNRGIHAGGVIGHGTLTDTVIEDNHADLLGGAVTGTWDVLRSTIADNTAGIYAGGALMDGTIEDSTISGNQAPAGAGLVFRDVTLRRSTITGNIGRNGSGVLSYVSTPPETSDSHLVVEDSTIAGNLDGPGAPSAEPSEISFSPGGLTPSVGWNADLTATRSILGDGTLPVCVLRDGVVTLAGYNFVSDTSCDAAPGWGDIVDGGDPKLGPLQDNGGPTSTRLPQAGSAVRDRIPVSDPRCAGSDRARRRPSAGHRL